MHAEQRRARLDLVGRATSDGAPHVLSYGYQGHTPIKDDNGSGLGRISAGFGFCGFGFGDGFSPTVFGFRAPKPFGFGFGFPPVNIQWISEINHLELKLMFYNILIIIYLLRLLNLFKVDS